MEAYAGQSAVGRLGRVLRTPRSRRTDPRVGRADWPRSRGPSGPCPALKVLATTSNRPDERQEQVPALGAISGRCQAAACLEVVARRRWRHFRPSGSTIAGGTRRARRLGRARGLVTLIPRREPGQHLRSRRAVPASARRPTRGCRRAACRTAPRPRVVTSPSRNGVTVGACSTAPARQDPPSAGPRPGHRKRPAAAAGRAYPFYRLGPVSTEEIVSAGGHYPSGVVQRSDRRDLRALQCRS